MRSFDYSRPATLDEASALLGSGGEVALIAGGHTLLPAIKSRLRAPDRLVDLGGIAGLDRIERDGDILWIGATARHGVVADSDVVKAAIPSLAKLALLIGDPQVRNRGTIGGSVANNDPAADYPAACLALDAVIETTAGRHDAGDFFQGMFATSLAEDEIVTRVGFRVAEAGAYAKFRHPASRYAMAAVYVARFADGWRVAVTGAGPGAFRWSEAEAALASGASTDGLIPDADNLNSDIHASAEYRAHLCAVMLGRALSKME
ncbi:FAD binding domain-containing protein [Sphingoaurantiacus capsulatus]|uniref:FAD binding domain-containing protein n=1 Tax=Sphingoaurantiacus capsulatus TaxID=1771310 RepID=A0ABV7XDA5_9SPHN